MILYSLKFFILDNMPKKMKMKPQQIAKQSCYDGQKAKETLTNHGSSNADKRK